MKYKLLFVLLLFFFNCKENEKTHVEDEDPFFFDKEESCLIDPNGSNSCLTNKPDLACFKTLEDLKKSNLEKIFFNKFWMGEDQQTLFYHIDTKGRIKIFEGGPDKNVEQRKLVGKGKIFIEKDNWFYEQKCELDSCESFRIPISYFHCTITQNSTEKYVLRTIQFGNRKFVESSEVEKNKQEKLILFIEESSIENQIFNGFVISKVPSIPTKETK